MARVSSAWIMLAAAAPLCGNAYAMASPNNQSPVCRVVDGDKLPAESGGATALCNAIEDAVAERAPSVAVTVEVKVVSSSRLKATLTRGGKRLPEQNFASMDRDLRQDSFDRFAAAIADALAKAH
jgi:hypothetical protein